jgi:dTDP-4-amino-4,6-dideoxygalactose transaminase
MGINLPVRKDFLVFGEPLIEQDEMNEVLDSMKRSWLGTGPKVHEFEKAFAEYKKSDHAAAVNSCTAALHLSCLSLGLAPGDEIITTPMTFCATINAIIHSGARPVLADIDPITLNIDVREIEKKITSKTRAVIVVHFAGRPCDMDPILELAKSQRISIIEDCAHAIETEYKGKKAGTFGELGCFSFYATKNITTGEGGMIISSDESLISRIKIMALHGLSRDAWKRYFDSGYRHYYVEEAGFKYNMMDLQAAIGIHQLKRIDEYWKRREKIWHRYMESMSDLNIGLPAPVEDNTRHAYHLFTIRIEPNKIGISRDDFLQAMTERNIGVGVHYLAIPEHPYYQKSFKWRGEDFPHAYAFGRETASLPISPKLTDQDVEDVISAVRGIVLRKED